MPSTYSPNLRLELQALGENRSTWGVKANNDFSLIEQAIAGMTTVNIADANMTLTAVNGTTDQARSAILKFTGTLTAARTVTIPTVSKIYLVVNSTTGGFAVDIKTSVGAAYSLPAGTTRLIYCDATNTQAAISLLPISEGGTGATDAATARTNLGLGSIATQNLNAVNITGGMIGSAVAAVTQTAGDNSSKLATTAFVAAGLTSKANATTTISAGSGLTGGGSLGANFSLALGTPTSISASTVNSSSGTTHTHAIDSEGVAAAGNAARGAGDVGTYAFAHRESGTAGFSFGATIAGSSLRSSNAGSALGTTLSGTWRCMGLVTSGSTTTGATTVWLRIS